MILETALLIGGLLLVMGIAGTILHQKTKYVPIPSEYDRKYEEDHATFTLRPKKEQNDI